MDKDFWKDLPLLRRDARLNVAANQNVMGGAKATALVWFTSHYALCKYHQGLR